MAPRCRFMHRVFQFNLVTELMFKTFSERLRSASWICWCRLEKVLLLVRFRAYLGKFYTLISNPTPLIRFGDTWSSGRFAGKGRGALNQIRADGAQVVAIGDETESAKAGERTDIPEC